MDLLHRAAGIAIEAEGAQDGVQEALTAAALDFLAAGGTLSLADFALLTPESRGAFRAAGRALRVELATLIGTATLSPEAAAELQAEIDGGALRDHLAVTAAASRAAAKLARKGGGA